MKKKSIFALVNYAMPLMALAFACASCGEKGSGPGPDPDPGEGGDGDVEPPLRHLLTIFKVKPTLPKC